ncbi:SPOR domain-containing protein [Celeribacter sp. PS-C1]|uniref:SPOR domain-containing protein n=1 Tax=Celeribacter sp. PS-C1 TaxID=2820813 RepID=UPI001CA5072C|nr:SPOR domain-containing protein [Celeribacter sp. PS-C1]MBW6417051.1 SPOR domain-containing protein [Celeribacter sp. PS-C1]
MTRQPHYGGQNHPGLSAAPDADRLFSNENVHFPPQSERAPSQDYSHDARHIAQGFHDPRASYEAGPAYVYDTSDMPEIEAKEPPRLGVAQIIGAIISLALILGLAIWGYKLMVRDVAGVPVIRALEGSARLLPDDPGGQLAMHQGLAVNSVTADGSAAAPADRYVLAPATASLTDEDQPMSEVQPVLSAYEPSSDAFALQPAPEVQAPAAEEGLEQIAVAEDPLELQSVEELAASVQDMAEDLATSDVMISPIPKPRPVRLASLAQSASASTTRTDAASLDGVAGDILAAIGGVTEMTPSEVPSGSRLVQFGAFQSEDIARSEWTRLSGRFEELMEGKTRVIERAESGGKSFYRLRAYGFADASDANRFCAALTAMNAACVPTVQR